MVIVVGGAYQGKTQYVKEQFPDISFREAGELSLEELLAAKGILNLQDFLYRMLSEAPEEALKTIDFPSGMEESFPGREDIGESIKDKGPVMLEGWKDKGPVMLEGWKDKGPVMLEGWKDKGPVMLEGWKDKGLLMKESMPSLEERLAVLFYGLCSCKERVITLQEVGSGVVPLDPFERGYREVVGRFGSLLCKEASQVVRICFGLEECIKPGRCIIPGGGDIPR